MNRTPQVSRGRYERRLAARLFPQLAQALDARGWTLADLARASGLTYQRLVVATSGHRAPSLDTQDKTAAALGMKPHELWQSESSARGAKSSGRPVARRPGHAAVRPRPAARRTSPEPEPRALEDVIEEARRKAAQFCIDAMGDESVPLKVRRQVRAMLDKKGLEVRDGEIVSKAAPRTRPKPWQ